MAKVGLKKKSTVSREPLNRTAGKGFSIKMHTTIFKR